MIADAMLTIRRFQKPDSYIPLSNAEVEHLVHVLEHDILEWPNMSDNARGILAKLKPFFA